MTPSNFLAFTVVALATLTAQAEPSRTASTDEARSAFRLPAKPGEPSASARSRAPADAAPGRGMPTTSDEARSLAGRRAADLGTVQGVRRTALPSSRTIGSTDEARASRRTELARRHLPAS
jgi:hypothetical protein